MQDEELHDQEEGFAGESVGEEILDVFDENIEDDIEEGPHHVDAEDEEEGLYDFFGIDEDDRDSMY